MTTPAEHFAKTASAHGYNETATRTMVDAATALHLPLDEATAWLAADITPWGAQAWKAEGFADGAEASNFRASGLTPADAYQARVDERGCARPATSV